MEFQIEYRTETTVQLDLEKSLKIFEQNQKSNRRYLKIMRIFQDPSQPLDREFQKLFNGFYRVRRGTDWQEACYHIMEMHRTDPSVTFPQLLNELTYHTGKVDFSFATKILHTINPRMPSLQPIWRCGTTMTVRSIEKCAEPSSSTINCNRLTGNCKPCRKCCNA